MGPSPAFLYICNSILFGMGISCGIGRAEKHIGVYTSTGNFGKS